MNFAGSLDKIKKSSKNMSMLFYDSVDNLHLNISDVFSQTVAVSSSLTGESPVSITLPPFFHGSFLTLSFLCHWLLRHNRVRPSVTGAASCPLRYKIFITMEFFQETEKEITAKDITISNAMFCQQ